jgi:hypothetical protein
MAVAWIMFMPQWEELYVWEVVVPQLERRYGFQVGPLTFSRDGTSWESTGLVAVSPDGKLARLGVRTGDAPYAYHGGGWIFFAHALAAHERNRPAEFEVVNAGDWNAGLGRQAFRTIELRAR